MPTPRWAFSCAAALTLAGCHESAALHAATRGDQASLGRDIAEGERTATLSLAETRELARAVAFRELTQASRKDAIARVGDVRACAPELDDALTYLMKTMDDAGAEAAAARLDAGLLSEGDAREFAASPADGWRAVGVRALTRSRDAEARRRALVDPSPRVRRAALHAMADDVDASDLAPALEAARVDPEPMVRSDAVRLVARMGRRKIAVARELSDLYPRADDAIREDIGAAWAAPGVIEAGGREELRVLLASDEGPGGVAAAAALLRESPTGDPELLHAARAELARVIASGPRRNRLHAIAAAPLDAGPDALLFVALDQASRDDDTDVRVSALGRLVSARAPAAARAEATKQLEAIAASLHPRLASRARQLLAYAGDARVQAWLEQDLRADDPASRLAAAAGLVALGRASRAAPVLADADASVRTRGACTLLLAARLGGAAR